MNNGNDANNNDDDVDVDAEPTSTISALHPGGDEHSVQALLLLPLNSPPRIRRELRYAATTNNCQGRKKKDDDDVNENSCGRIDRGQEEETSKEKGLVSVDVHIEVDVHGTHFSSTAPSSSPPLLSSSRNQKTKRASLSSSFLEDSEHQSPPSSSVRCSLSSFSPSGASISSTRNTSSSSSTRTHTNGESRDITEFRRRLKAIQEKRAKHKQTHNNRLENRVLSPPLPAPSPLICQQIIIKGGSSRRGDGSARAHTHAHTRATATNKSKSEPSVSSLGGDETVETRSRALQKKEGDILRVQMNSQLNLHSTDSSQHSPQTSSISTVSTSTCRTFDETTIHNNVGTNTTKRWLEFFPSHLSASALALTLTLASSTSIDMSSSSNCSSSSRTTRETGKHNHTRSLRRLVCTSPETNVDTSFEHIRNDAACNATATTVNHDGHCYEATTPAVGSTRINGHTTTTARTHTGEKERQYCYGEVTRPSSDASPSLNTTTATRTTSTIPSNSSTNSSRLDRLVCTKSRSFAVHVVGKELNKSPRCAGGKWLPKSDPKQQQHHSSSLLVRALNNDDCDCDDHDNGKVDSNSSSNSNSNSIEHDKKSRDGLCNGGTIIYQATAGFPSPGQRFLPATSMQSFVPSPSPSSHSYSGDTVGSNDDDHQQSSSSISSSSIHQDVQESKQTSPITTTTTATSTDNHHGTCSTTTNSRRTPLLRVPRFSRFRKDPWYLRPAATTATSKTTESRNGTVVFHGDDDDDVNHGTRTSNSNDYFERMMHAVVFVKG